jgi:hypothetical protein
VGADLRRFYGLRLRDVLADEDFECRELYDLIWSLPPESALSRAQGQLSPMEFMDEWGKTILQFLAGNRVKTPSMTRKVEPSHKQTLVESLKKALNG